MGLKSETLSQENGHALMKVTGRNVWKSFQHEPGKHVVQRVPPTERSGRRQTSVISVAVLSLPPENKLVPLRDQDLEIITQTGKQKAGGQNVNKVASAVRMKHKPSGLSVFINGRDQGANKKEALRILTARVHTMKSEREQSAYDSTRKAVLGDSGRGDKVRTYNFMRHEIVDHRLNKKTNKIDHFMKGDFSVLFNQESNEETDD